MTAEQQEAALRGQRDQLSVRMQQLRRQLISVAADPKQRELAQQINREFRALQPEFRRVARAHADAKAAAAAIKTTPPCAPKSRMVWI